MSKVQLNVLRSQARIAPSWPPDTNEERPLVPVPEPLIDSYLPEFYIEGMRRLVTASACATMDFTCL